MSGIKNASARDSEAAFFSSTYDRVDGKNDAGTTLVTFNIAWATDGTGRIILDPSPVAATATVSGGGTEDMASATLYNSGGSEAIEDLTVGTSGADVNFSTTTVQDGGEVRLNSIELTITTQFN